ncbi:exocyst complex subunit Exo3 [Schizosaccharomyces pombe]|uniref:Exocyst complex component sec6 n=1 Tax=Schizosaccharomyces pombe (strain 972 / ATCC 24843) TaxID=284812 RepID=SEC6_SCHPO|nr:exocyst complex subunit Sec6 [Schizosaccharomyces pombe]O74846.2 RecName: Full=Exocyst complex component sec6 [Schizosaccharomyces pombe 972h-]CAA21114.2 exocyst complex subunit Sec6 [Schizosaccharomyces pombe]|eukprot:NP_587736.2 exocyst complex subunit Sec6 [Schizosaccharomyces pombe]
MTAAASDDAVYNKVADILRQCEDFHRLSTHIERFEREQASLNMHVKTELEKHVEAVELGKLALHDAQTKRVKLLQELHNMLTLCESAREMVDEFPLISRMSRIYKNCYATKQMISQLNNLVKETDVIEDMLREDLELDSDMPNLLRAHYKLSKLREFREEALYQASLEGQSDLPITLENSFSNLNTLSDNFDRLVLNFCRNIFQLVKSGHIKTIVQIFKIVEAEESSDEVLKSIRDAKSSLPDSQDGPFLSLQGMTRQLRNFRLRVLEEFQGAAAENFQRAWVSYLEDGSGELNLDFIFEDLKVAFYVLPDLTPPSYNIAKTFASIYQECLVGLVTKAVSLDTPAAVYLYLINFHREYRKFFEENAPFSVDEVEPGLEDGKDGILVREYTRLFTQKIREWSDKLFQSSVDTFMKRESEPELDSDGNYGLQGTIIFFQMITQQINIISHTNNSDVVGIVLSSIMYIMQSMQDQWKSVMRSELSQQLSGNPESVPPGLMEYLLAVANDNLKCAGFMDNTLLNTFELITSEREEDLREAFGKTVDGYILISDIGVSQIVAIISNDVKPALTSLFQPNWYQSSNMKLIVDTFRDYIVDCIEHMVPGLFDVFLLEASNALTISYLRSIFNKNACFDGDNAIQQIRSDIALAIRVFGEYMAAEHLRSTFEPIEKLLLGMLDADVETVSEYFHLLKEAYWDAPLSLVEAVLQNRTDLEKSIIKKMIDIVRHENDSLQIDTSQQPTVFSQVTSLSGSSIL